ncbi:MAG: hypothetical protein C4339_01165 [Nitrososphaerota archaeon]
MRPPSALLLDFVGTLVLFKPDPQGAVRCLFEELAPLLNERDFGSFHGAYMRAYNKYLAIRRTQLVEVSNDVWLQEACRALDPAIELDKGLLERAITRYFTCFMRGLRPAPGARSTLHYLARQKGYRLGLVSNFSYAPFLRARLEGLGLSGFFEVLAISHEVGYRKPHPAIFRFALERLGCAPEEALMVGDTPSEDVYGARKLGMGACLVRSSLTDSYAAYEVDSAEASLLSPDLIIDQLSGLRALL